MNFLKSFLSDRFTSFRFAWGFVSLFVSVGTFCIVLTDKFPHLNLVVTISGVLLFLLVFSFVLDLTKIRHEINFSESNTNPLSLETNKLCKEILAKMEK